MLKRELPAEKDEGDKEDVSQLVPAQLGMKNIRIGVEYEIQRKDI